MRIIYILLTTLLCLVTLTTSSQQQTAVFLESASATGVQQMFYKNSVVKNVGDDVFTCGATLNEDGDYDMLLTKHNSSNVLQWSVTYAGSYGGDDFASDLAIDPNGNILVTGTKQVGSLDFDAVIVKYNSSGTQQWVQTYAGAGGGPDGFTTVVLNGTNEIYVAGGAFESIYQLTNSLCIRYDSTGTAIWTNTWNNSTYNLQDTGARIVLSGGYTYVYSASQSAVSPVAWKLARQKYVSSSGALNSNSVSAGDDVEFHAVSDIALDNVSYIYVCGTVKATGEERNIRIARFDTLLEADWVYDYNGASDLDDEALSMEVVGTSYVYVTGYSTSSATGKDIYSVKIGATSGTVAWEEILDLEGGDDEGNYIAMDSGNNSVIAGTSFKDENLDVVVVGVKNSNGAHLYTGRYNSVFNMDDHANSAAVDPVTNEIYISGQVEKAPGEYSFILTKWTPRTIYNPIPTDGFSGAGGYITNNGQLRNLDGESNTTVKFYSQQFRVATNINDTLCSYQLFQAQDTSNVDTMVRVDMKFTKGNTYNKVYPLGERPEFHNYFLSHMAQASERTPVVNEVVKFNTYTNTDIIFTHSPEGFRHWIVARSGAPTSDFEMTFEGQSTLNVDGSGKLVITTGLGSITYTKAKAFTMNNSTGVLTLLGWQPSYSVSSNHVSFTSFGSWSGTLVLEFGSPSAGAAMPPASNENLEWSTYFGGANSTSFFSVASNADADVWTVGYTATSFFPSFNGIYVSAFGGYRDATMVKFNSLCEAVFLTFYGGNGAEEFSGCALGPNNSLYAVGEIDGTDPDISDSGLDFGPQGGIDGLFVHFNSQTGIVQSDSRIGGESTDAVYDVFLETISNSTTIILVGYTFSDDWAAPATQTNGGYYQDFRAGGQDGFIVKLDGEENPGYCTFFGGEDWDVISDVELVNANIVICGYTLTDHYSNDECDVPSDGGFPSCGDGNSWQHEWFETTGAAPGCNYVAQLDWESGALEWCTYVGKSNAQLNTTRHPKMKVVNAGTGLNATHNVYMASYLHNGSAGDDGLPITSYGSYNQADPPGDSENGIHWFTIHNNEHQLKWCSYFGGESWEYTSAVDVDPETGFIYVVGTANIQSIQESGYCTSPSDGEFPICNLQDNCYIETDAGYDRAYIACFSPEIEALWITEFGQGWGSKGFGLSVNNGKVFIVGETVSSWTPWEFNTDFDSNDYYQGNIGSSSGGNPNGTIARFSVEEIHTSIPESSKPLSIITVFPNPSSDKITIQFPRQYNGNNISMFDAYGRLLITERLSKTGTHSIITRNFASGIYFMRIEGYYEHFKLFVKK